MKHKELGSSGVMIPEIGLGTWDYTGGDGPLSRGIDLGAFLIDTAEGYGTETAVGGAVAGRRDSAFIATKVSPEHLRYDDVIAAAERSLKRLGTDYIDLYQVHWPDPRIPIEETMQAMDRLVDDGKVRSIGVCNFSATQLAEAMAAAHHGIVSDQVPYSLAQREAERELLPYCRKNGVTVIAYSPLAVGVGNIRSALGPGVLEGVAESAGKTEAQVALNWCISKGRVVAIPKSNSVQRTEENCGASGWRLSRDQVKALEGR